MINDIPTFLEILAQNHTFRPDNKRIPEEDVREIENLIEELEIFIDKVVSGKASMEYPQFNLLSDRVKNFLLVLLFDEIGVLRDEDE